MKGAQDAAGHLAWAAPQVSGSGAPAVISAGIDVRGKKYTAMPVESHFTRSNENPTSALSLQPYVSMNDTLA